MVKKHVTARLSQDAINVIVAHQKELEVVYHREFSFGETIEDMVQNYPKKLKFMAFLFRKKKKPMPDWMTKDLEAFTHG